MNSPIIRMATSTNAVRNGFFAAGLTVAGIAAVQTFWIVLAWIVASVI
jgi:threonine/homoserine/homoserine lactone efflux protein